jgi:glycosyltransferase involved in cell wall biosynthesis
VGSVTISKLSFRFITCASKIHRADFKLVSYIRDYEYPKWIFQLIGDEVDKYLFVSESIKDFYQLSGETIYLGSAFKPVSKKNTSKKFVIGYLGRLVDWKGAKELLEAYQKLSVENIELVLWGSGEKQPGSIEKTLKKTLIPGVCFEGFIDKPSKAFAKMDCFVLPSKKAEPFATTVIEAALAGVPIIATNIGGTPEFIKHEKNGLLVDPADTNQLAAALLRLIKEPLFAKKIAQQAQKDAQKFTQEKFILKFEKALLN